MYYAAFYIVTAYLTSIDVKVGTHKSTRNMLHQHLISSSFIDREYGIHYDILFEQRQDGDYADFITFKAEEIAPLIEPTKDFILHIHELINNQKTTI